MEIYGFDASHYQTIDFLQVKASGQASFVILKASEGTTYVDPSFEDYFTKANTVGLNVGAYHFGDFGTVEEALAEAAHFEDTIKGKVFSYPIALDLEENKSGASVQQLTDAAIAFCEYFENKGYFIEIYSGKSFYENSLDPVRLAPYASWIARYGVSSLGREAGMWQYSSSGHILGISGAVDLDVAYQDFSMVNPKPAEPVKVTPVVAPTPVPVQAAPIVVPSTYTVKSGDTLSGIAAKFGLTSVFIQTLNGITNPNLIQVGQTLKLKVVVAPVQSSGIKAIGTIQIVNVSHAAIICDKPSSTNSKNLGLAAKGSKLPISGSVPGFYEVIYNGQRAYVNEKYATRV